MVVVLVLMLIRKLMVQKVEIQLLLDTKVTVAVVREASGVAILAMASVEETEAALTEALAAAMVELPAVAAVEVAA